VGFRTDQEVKMAFFWKVTPWTLVDIYWRFTSTYCLQHQGDRLIRVVS
jgi:hypothetical protein